MCSFVLEGGGRYGHVLARLLGGRINEVALAAAEATAKIIPRTATRQLGHVTDH